LTGADELRPQRNYPCGQVVELSHRSESLAAAALGEPVERIHHVYLPPGYADSGERYPLLVCLAPYTSSGPAQVGWRNHGENLPQRLDRLQAEGRMGPVIVLFPESYTVLGGNQFVDSPVLGSWADVVGRELVERVDAEYRTLGTPDTRAVFGKSSGGFGALHLAMTQPGRWGGAACHAGDMGFDRCYRPGFPSACRVLEQHDYDLEVFVRAFWRRNKPAGPEFEALMVLCLAASYDPDPQRPLGLRLPFTPRTCELIDEAWAAWLRFDPLRAAPAHADALHALRGLWLDVGRDDQYFIQYGTRQLGGILSELNVAHRFEEFEGTHSGIDWRLDESLPFLYESLQT